MHYSLKNIILKKVFHSKHGLWRRTCCCCRCLYIRKEEKKRKKRKKHSTWVKPWLMQKRCLWVLQHSTTYNTLQHFTTSYKHLPSIQMQIKLSVSSCFLFMVSILLFLYQLYFYLVKQKFLKNVIFFYFEHDHSESIWLTNSTPIHFNRVSLSYYATFNFSKTPNMFESH